MYEAPAHTAKHTQKWCSENLQCCGARKGTSEVTDFSPTENLLSILKYKVTKRGHGTTTAALASSPVVALLPVTGHGLHGLHPHIYCSAHPD